MFNYTSVHEFEKNVSDGGGPAPQPGGPPSETGSLGIHYKIGISTAGSKRVLRFILQRAAGEILPDERVQWCNRRVLPDREFVGISYSEEQKKAHYQGLMRCCQIWICPVCAQKVIFERKNEIRTGVANYKAAGGHAYMLTFTLQHNQGDTLDRVLGDLLLSVQRVFTAVWWQSVKEDLQIQGLITALETRWGVNGWHPHKHILLLCKQQLHQVDQVELGKELTRRYCRQLARLGAYANPDIGVVLTEDKDDGGYLAKWGIDDEMSKGAMKPGRSGSKSPFDLLLWSTTGEALPGRLFKEFWKSIRGKRQLVFHKGTRKLLGLLPALAEDQAILDQAPADDVEFYQVALDVWSKVCQLRLRGQLLDVAENRGLEGVEGFLRGLYE